MTPTVAASVPVADIVCCAVGSVYGTLDEHSKVLHTADMDIPVSFNRSFTFWLQDTKADLSSPRTFAALPKTLKSPPYITYEIIGVDSANEDTNDYVRVVGQCIYYNPVYEYSLFRVIKSENKSFTIKLEGRIHEPDSQEPPVGQFYQIRAKREGNCFSIKHIRRMT